MLILATTGHIIILRTENGQKRQIFRELFVAPQPYTFSVPICSEW